MNACTICGYVLHGARALWSTCQRCHDRITSLLAAIEDDWPRLSDCLEPVRGHSGPRVSGSTSHTLPISGRILALIGPTGVPTRLYWRYADLALARRIQPATMPPGADHRVRLALWGIRKHLPWGVQAADLGKLLAELEQVADDLASVVGAPAPAQSVPCPAELPDDGGRCRGRMRYDSARNSAWCPSCRTRLDPGQWLDVWVKLGQPAA